MNTFLNTLLLSAALLFNAGQASAEPATLNQPDKAAMPAVAAHYLLKSGEQQANWYLIRETDQVKTYNQSRQQGELWRRDAQGRIEHQRLFPADKKVVEYTQGQLITMKRLPEWDHVATLIDHHERGSLKKTGERQVMGQTAWVLEGKLHGADTIIWWLPVLQLPARMETRVGALRSVMELQSTYAQAPAAWNWFDSTVTDQYDRIDASDFGDMESDPFVQRLLAQEGHGHHHH